MHRFIFPLVVAVLMTGLWPAEPALGQSKEDRAAVENLMAVSGADKIATQMANLLLPQFIAAVESGAQKPIPPAIKTAMSEEILATFEENFPGMIDMVVPIYLKYFTPAEIRNITAFYNTSTGQKAARLMPQMMSESAVAGQKWSQSLIPDLQRRLGARLRKEGFIDQ